VDRKSSSSGASKSSAIHPLSTRAKRPPTDALEADDDELARELARAGAARAALPRPVDPARAARLARARAAVDDVLAEE